MNEHRVVTNGLPEKGVFRVTKCCKAEYECTGALTQACSECGEEIYSDTGGFLARCVCCDQECGTYHKCKTCKMVMSSFCANTEDGDSVDICKKCVGAIEVPAVAPRPQAEAKAEKKKGE
jgi:hypothetical protein